MKMSIIVLLLSISSILSKEPKTITLTYEEETGYYIIPIAFGSNKEEFGLQVDTTTSETWIPSNKTTLKVKKYDISKSSKGQRTNKTFEIEDEDGDVRGKACYDSIKVGDISLDHFGFVLVDEFEHPFNDYEQGKLGLGYKQEHGNDFNFLRKLKLNKIIEKEVFLINQETKELILGDFPPEFQNQLYTSCPVVETNDLDDEYRQAWACELTHLAFNLDKKSKNFDLDQAFEVNARITFDSAYPYISIPKRHLNAFKEKFMNTYFKNNYKEVKSEDSTYFIITDEELIPGSSISFIIEGYAYIIPSDYLFIKTEEGEFELLVRFYKENDNIFGFGAPFMDFFTVVFDYEEGEVGFFGGSRKELQREWYDYLNEMTPEQQKARRRRMYIYAGVCFFLAVIIILLCYRNRKERNMGRRFRNPLEEEA
jgi:hypothetical protein